ncbi:unnamed protein product [Symbiodinium natans]|uniref:Uncharacterized protein n=1 Tax=Symbiodinium natans TaxID=878477 RepID=A0A812QZ39_9DINO|nr:unnamed protein product [Symbiodinium natans]
MAGNYGKQEKLDSVLVAGALVAKLPDSARTRISAETGWPSDLVAAAGVGVRGVIPRGTLFERFMTCPSEPTRNGTYQFCVVGLDVSTPGQLRYMAWEPTGYFDRWFAADEVELRLALQKASTNLGQAKDAARAAGPRRWPDAGDPHRGQVHNGLLPELTATGRPTLSSASRHQPRTTIDVLEPLLHEWRRRFLPTLRLRTASPRLLVFDSSGRLARHLQESLDDFEVVAADDRTVPKPKRHSLGSLREKAHFEVKEDALKTSPPALNAKAEAFDVILVPFALQRREKLLR